MTYFFPGYRPCPPRHPLMRSPRNNTVANRLLVLVLALLAGVVYLLYRLKARART